jgi:hypothetical protein
MSKQCGVVEGQATEHSFSSWQPDSGKYFPPVFCFRAWMCAVVLCLAALAAPAQQQPAAAKAPASLPNQAQANVPTEQQRQLFSLVDELIQFSSDETGLPVKSTVKRRITSRAAVENYVKTKFEEDESARRMQRNEIVLKKFGLLDRDFALKPFLLKLLAEQVEAYYDPKTKTVNLLDWVSVDEQKPVLAHELTHALQDQHSDLEKWGHQTPDDVSLNSAEDAGHLARDEMDTAREAVVEGQATVVMVDYLLKPMGKSLVKDPEILDYVRQQMVGNENSPVLARAPLLLSESLLFPYREGLGFEQDVWMNQGQTAAFAGALDRPPTSSWEILNPREYEKRNAPAVPLLPNIHPLVDKLYKPYDIGQIGQLDLRILTELFGGERVSRDLTPAWNGGLYWAGQRLSARTAAEQSSTNSIAIFYLSAWKNAASAQAFARLYAEELGRKYSSVQLDPAASSSLSGEQAYSTSEGPVIITTRGKLVFVAESFPLELGRKLTALILDAQGSGEVHLAQAAQPDATAFDSRNLKPVTGGLVDFFSHCGVLKAAAEAARQAAR